MGDGSTDYNRNMDLIGGKTPILIRRNSEGGPAEVVEPSETGVIQRPTGARRTLPRYRTKRCKEPTCGVVFQPRQVEQEFHSDRCKKRWWNRAGGRAAQVYALLVEWRTTRGGRKGCLGEIAHIVDKWIAQDRAQPKEK